MATWADKIIEAHTRITDAVSHYERLKSERYFVWQEEGTETMTANNRPQEKAMRGTTDFFTKKEFDPWKNAFENSMTRRGIIWSLNSIQYEEDTGFIHYEWLWYVTGSDI